MDTPPERLRAVSYTHLDVYKRQKYNFDSKRPESDQYSFELKYMMPDESYWTFKIRRYDWEYSEYVETDYLISYSIPIGIPVGKKKSLGMLIGRVWTAQELSLIHI